MPIAKESYGRLPDGTEIELFTLSNAAGMRVKIITYGAILTEVVVPDRDGKMANVNLGRDSLADYVADNSPCLGATIGRFAGRIARGKFTLDGKEYSLALNAGGKHHIHGGWKGFNKVAWQARPVDGGVGVALSYVSPDGEEGYPGQLSVQLTYSLTDANELRLEYTAECDKPTIINLTNHAYWNLAGAGSGDVLGHELTIHADRFLEGDEDLLPAGPPQPVKDTPCDFTQPIAIGANRPGRPRLRQLLRVEEARRRRRPVAGRRSVRATVRADDGSFHDRTGGPVLHRQFSRRHDRFGRQGIPPPFRLLPGNAAFS